jgi:hypothetical protein
VNPLYEPILVFPKFDPITAPGMALRVNLGPKCQNLFPLVRLSGIESETKLNSIPLSLRLSGKIVSPTIMAQSKKLFYKTLIFMPIYLRKSTNFKIEAKKILIRVYL